MIKSAEKSPSFNGKLIAKNSIYNLLGYILPLLIAIILIPPLISGLGTEKFGLLSLAWVVIGYFSFFDFGIGRALTKMIAEKIGSQREEEIPGLFWTSFFLMLIISLIITVILIFLTPDLVKNVFKITPGLQAESIKTFYVLALSVPIVTTNTGVRGVLEAYQRFGTVSIIRIFLGIFTFLGPLICLIFSKSLFWVVLFLMFIRLFVWVTYFIFCFRINSSIKQKIRFDLKLIKPVLKLSGWMTVSNVVGPLITYLDRFLIGIIISAAAITFYATPYEIITKLFLIPTALMGVLFPIFSSSFQSQPDLSIKLFKRGVKYIFIFLYPIVLLSITFAYEGINLWLGQKFAADSFLVLQLLSVGVLFNGFAFLPFTFLQGIGRPDIPAKVNLIELPFYLAAMWISIKSLGINGAALVFLILFLINAVILFLYVYKILEYKFEFDYRIYTLFFMILFLLLPFFLNNLLFKILFAGGMILFFTVFTLKYLLLHEEKLFFSSKMEALKMSFVKNKV